MRFTIVCMMILYATSQCYAQDQDKVLSQGQVVYERKVYLIKNLEDMGISNGDWLDRMRDKLPKTVMTNFELDFTPERAYFKKSEVQDGTADKVPSWLQGYTSTNEVYTDMSRSQMVIKKTELGKDFIIEDSFPEMKWKITDEFKTIAGFACRKATTIVQDSLFIIAFYTDALLPSIGPEHFYGLPGTILGVAIPRLHTSYLAQEVKSIKVDGDAMKKPTKGEKTNLKNFESKLRETGEGFRKGAGERMAWGIWI